MQKIRLLSTLVILLGLIACESRDSQRVAASESSLDNIENAPAQEPRKLPAPPGEPGPVLIRLSDSFPTQIFASASNEGKIAIGMQSDARDFSLCPVTELPVCFRGIGVVTERMNPNEPKKVILYESDTQSGSRIDDVAATEHHYVFALNEGLYVGDEAVTSLVVVNDAVQIERKTVLSSPDKSIVRISMSSLADNQILVCSAQSTKQQNHLLHCDAFEPATAKLTPVGEFHTAEPIRSFAVGVSGERVLLVWTESGHAKAAFLDKSADVLDLGLSTVHSPEIAVGLDDFAVIWQGDDATMRVDRIPVSRPLREIDRQSIVLNGLDFRTVGGIAAISDGYVFAFRHQNTQQIGLISADFKDWHLIENNQVWRMFTGYAGLDIQDAHTGKMIWQTAESLISIK